MFPTPEQLAKSMEINRQADALAAADRTKTYAAAPICFFCGNKVMPEHAAWGRPGEHRSCTEEIFYHETQSEEE